MISRRSIRVKVLQSLYSQLVIKGNDVDEVKGLYDTSMDELFLVQLTYLLYFQKLVEYTDTYESLQKEKFLIADNMKEVDKSLYNLALYKYLVESESYAKNIKKFKIEQYIETDYIRKMFTEILPLESYLNYQSNSSVNNEVSFCVALFKKVLFKNADLKDHLESYFGNIEEDSDLIHFAIRKNHKTYEKSEKLNIEIGKAAFHKFNDFAYDLIDKTLENNEEYLSIIEPKLIGWELERISLIDLTIIKMSITEMLHMPEVPLKVTMNEYIEIAKMFCSPKSKDFINGVVDRVMKELDHQGKIKKEGRGLK